jgi:transposase-like protein
VRRPEFSRLVGSLGRLSPHQLRQLSDRVGQIAKRDAVRELVALRGPELGGCPYCSAKAYLRWGRTHAGEQRYRCSDCQRSFTALTGTVFARLHHKRLLIEHATCMAETVSVRKTAMRLGVHRNTAFRLRHLMLPKLERHQPSQLSGVAEIDEAFFRESFKGRKRGLPRAPYSRGTPAKKRGISSEQIPVLTAVCRGTRSSHITVLPPVPTTKTVAAALRAVVADDTVLCADSATLYRALGKDLGITLRQIPSGTHKLGPYHIQNVNALHSRMRRWFFPFRGVATKNLSAYLAWFRYFDRHGEDGRARQFLLDALGMSVSTLTA